MINTDNDTETSVFRFRCLVTDDCPENASPLETNRLNVARGCRECCETRAFPWPLARSGVQML
jgi:hypothetical protein